MVFHLVNSDYRMTGTVAFQFKTFQRRQSERREWSLHLIPIGHLGLFLRVEWVGIVTDQFTMELFETLVLIISSMIQFDKNTNPVFQETSEWLPDRFQSRDRFQSHESLYMRRVQSPQDLFVHHWQLFHCSVRLYGEGGGRRGWRHFFSCGNNCFYSLSIHPLVRGTARPQTQQSLISFLHSHSLCCLATPLAIARGHKKTADCKIIELELRKVFGQSSL